jgi:hypothetical protein
VNASCLILSTPVTFTLLKVASYQSSSDYHGIGKNSLQVLSICGNSFKAVGKAFQVKLVTVLT